MGFKMCTVKQLNNKLFLYGVDLDFTSTAVKYQEMSGCTNIMQHKVILSLIFEILNQSSLGKCLRGDVQVLHSFPQIIIMQLNSQSSNQPQ